MKANLIFSLFFVGYISVYGQVGIGVSSPSNMLEVDNGDVYITDKFYVDNLPAYDGHTLGPGSFRIVAVDADSHANGSPVDGRLMEFVGNQEIMPIIIQAYNVSNLDADNLTDLNLNISTSKYVISLSNFEAIPVGGAQGIYRKSASGGNYVYDNFVIRTFENSGTWHVEIRARDANPQTGSYQYNFDVVLFPKRFFRNLGTIPYNLNGSNTGAAPSAPTGI
ncbi:hypothetical protein [Moheibacter lacus]|uniref:Uncharacterized protein n=1 Tax=Moheibacter lacus TaxID=2745851 RepID=A0A838ZN08_9FLAO|nr:hypothetical protein [Moheibacter lacus]MBA5629250.1 hypothetical protein [Moheibacter lacus]